MIENMIKFRKLLKNKAVKDRKSENNQKEIKKNSLLCHDFCQKRC